MSDQRKDDPAHSHEQRAPDGLDPGVRADRQSPRNDHPMVAVVVSPEMLARASSRLTPSITASPSTRRPG